MKILESTLTYPLSRLANMNLMSLLKSQLENCKGELKVNTCVINIWQHTLLKRVSQVMLTLILNLV